MGKIGKIKDFFVDDIPKKSFLRLGKKQLFPFFTITFFLVLLFFTVYVFVFHRPLMKSNFLISDIDKIVKILERIDKECNILSISGERHPVNFFTVKEFAGSEIGPLNLAHPDQWRGPYLDNNPAAGGKFYEIVRAKDGYYIVPGYGVQLPNGLIIGKDFKIDREVNVKEMLQNDGKLNYQKMIFAKRLEFVIGDWEFAPKKKERLEKIDVSIKEFNTAVPYTYNTTSGDIGV
ncbi:hypothetical protein KAW80_03120 [Candidatus Babeliales bacterium]|nr:hypothetical protein [Candidatus Babeliales bacterium]